MGSEVTVEAAWQEEMCFSFRTPSGHDVVLDAAAEHGGTNRGPRPMEMLLVGVAGCTAMDVISILRKMRQTVTGYRVRITGRRGDDGDLHPYEHIVIEHIVEGDVEESRLARAVELSNTRYCSAQATLRREVEVETTYSVRAAGS